MPATDRTGDAMTDLTSRQLLDAIFRSLRRTARRFAHRRRAAEKRAEAAKRTHQLKTGKQKPKRSFKRKKTR
jgi:hypothetical protein